MKTETSLRLFFLRFAAFRVSRSVFETCGLFRLFFFSCLRFASYFYFAHSCSFFHFVPRLSSPFRFFFFIFFIFSFSFLHSLSTFVPPFFRLAFCPCTRKKLSRLPALYHVRFSPSLSRETRNCLLCLYFLPHHFLTHLHTCRSTLSSRTVMINIFTLLSYDEIIF